MTNLCKHSVIYTILLLQIKDADGLLYQLIACGSPAATFVQAIRQLSTNLQDFKRLVNAACGSGHVVFHTILTKLFNCSAKK